MAAALKEEFEVLFEVWYLDCWSRQTYGQSALGGKRKPILAVVILTTDAAATKSLQSCLTLCNPMDCSPPGSSIHGILQARVLDWVAIASLGKYNQNHSEISPHTLG